jgi:lysozyme
MSTFRIKLGDLLNERFPNAKLVGVSLADLEFEFEEQPAEQPVTQSVAQLLSVLEAMLRFEEGVRYVEYNDSKGNPTIGIGHLITTADRRKYPVTSGGKLTMTPAEVSEVFQQDVQTAISDAKKWIGSAWDGLSVNRQAVCVGMAYQLGATSLNGFIQTREHILQAEWKDVKEHFLATKWFRDTPNRVYRMADIMVTDTLPDVYFK